MFTKILYWLFFSKAFAQTTGSNPGGTTGSNPPGSVTLINPLGTNNIVTVINNITGWLIAVGAPIVTIMVLIGAFQMLFAGGSPETFKRGQKTILYSVIGFVIVLLARGVAAVIQAIATNTNP